MKLPRLGPLVGSDPVDFQETTFCLDFLGPKVCSRWEEIEQQHTAGGKPFDVIIVGAGMYGAYLADKLFRMSAGTSMRILVIEAGWFLLPTHFQNLPESVVASINAYPEQSKGDADGIYREGVWHVPWTSDQGFRGLASCVGGRSIFWGGWAPRLVHNDYATWPKEVVDFLTGPRGYALVEKEIGVVPSTEYIIHADLYKALSKAFASVLPHVPTLTEYEEAPLAVQAGPPQPGLFPFDKFSSVTFLMNAIRDNWNAHLGDGNARDRRLFLLPRTRVARLKREGDAVVEVALIDSDGDLHTLDIPPGAVVVLANSVIESTRLALNDLGVGDTSKGKPRLGNLMAHVRSNIFVRIRRSALAGFGLPELKKTITEVAAFVVRGETMGRRFHYMVVAAAQPSNPESVIWNMIPDVEVIDGLVRSQDPEWVAMAFRGMGEMEGLQSLTVDDNLSWIEASDQTDVYGVPRAYVRLVPTANDNQLWDSMDRTVFSVAREIAGSDADIQYLVDGNWGGPPDLSNPAAYSGWRDPIGSSHHEGGTLYMGSEGRSITDYHGRFHRVRNVYAVGSALYPTVGSANPVLPGLTLTRWVADAIMAGHKCQLRA
jgi:hypothetical protein